MIKQNSLSKRLTALILCAVMTVVSLTFGANAVTLSQSDNDKINGYREQQAALDSQISASQSKIDGLKDDIAREKEYVAELDVQIANYQSKIDVLNASIDELEAQKAEINAAIKELEDRIDAVKKDINHNNISIIDAQHEIGDIKNELKANICNLYENGTASELAYLLACSSFADYLTLVEISSNKAKHDAEIVETINSDIAEVENLNRENEALIVELDGMIDEKQTEIDALNETESKLEGQRKELEDAQGEIEALVEESMKKIRELDSQSALYQSMIHNYESQQAALDSKIDSIIAAAQEAERRRREEEERRQQEANGTYTPPPSYSPSSGFTWPLPYGDAYISSAYGYRTSPLTGSYSLHGGVDTCCRSGTQGKKVVAAAGGTVIYSSFNGYGNCIIIDHGSGYVTLYGHLDSKAVGVGSYVSKGQVIGYAGNTYGPGGYSTGPHLHFELRVNGAKVNPLGYCSP